MNNNQNAPVSISVVFENVDSHVWSSSTLSPNHFVYFFPETWFFGLNCFFKKELFMNQSTLIEHSAIDNNDFWPESMSLNTLFSNNKITAYYVYYFYHLKLKITTFLLPHTNSSLMSVDSIYYNASWLERESAEMYGLYFSGKKDHRKLLLDYSKVDSPMLKDFSTEGNIDCFYNFFEDQVCTVSSEVVEL